MSTLAHPPSARELLTILEFAQRVHWSERTVRYDLARGRLPKVHSHGRTFVPSSALASYRAPRDFLPNLFPPGAHATSERFLTVEQVMDITRLSRRTVRRRIGEQAFVVVRFGPRCLRIDAQRTKVYPFKRNGRIHVGHRPPLSPSREFCGMSLAELQAKGPEWLSDDDHWLIDFRVDEVHHVVATYMLSVRAIAQLWERSKRGRKSTGEVYRYVAKAENRGLPVERRGGRLWIPVHGVLAYAADDPDVIREIITLLVNFVSYGDNGAEKAAIRRCFETWLVAHPPRLGVAWHENAWHENYRSARW